MVDSKFIFRILLLVTILFVGCTSDIQTKSIIKKELNYGDHVKISVAAADFDKIGFDLFYKLEVITSDETILAGKAKTGMLCYDYQQKKKVSVPDEVIKKLSAQKKTEPL